MAIMIHELCIFWTRNQNHYLTVPRTSWVFCFAEKVPIWRMASPESKPHASALVPGPTATVKIFVFRSVHDYTQSLPPCTSFRYQKNLWSRNMRVSHFQRLPRKSYLCSPSTLEVDLPQPNLTRRQNGQRLRLWPKLSWILSAHY